MAGPRVHSPRGIRGRRFVASHVHVLATDERPRRYLDASHGLTLLIAASKLDVRMLANQAGHPSRWSTLVYKVWIWRGGS